MALRELMPHQNRALRWSSPRSEIALFMEMRLGKSAVAIRWASARLSTRALVVAPASTIPDWQDELLKEGWDSCWIYGGSKTSRLQKFYDNLKHRWILVSYDTLRVTPELADHVWDVVIADESTRIRNPKAKITKVFLKRFKNVQNKAILSGFPDPESWMDLCSQFLWLKGEFVGCQNYWQAQRRFYNHVAYAWFPRKGTKEKFATYLSQNSFVRSRKHCKVGSVKLYEARYVELTDRQKDLIKSLETNFALPPIRGSAGDLEAFKTKWRVSVQIAYQRIAGGFRPERGGSILVSDAKLVELQELVKNELKLESHIVVWFKYNHEIHVANAMLRSMGRDTTVITGKTPPVARGDLLRYWRRNGGVLCAQVKCARYGVDCSQADTAIYYSTPYDAEYRIQSEDRIVHPQKRTPLLIIDLVTRGTVDEDIHKALVAKKYDAAEVFKNYLERRRSA